MRVGSKKWAAETAKRSGAPSGKKKARKVQPGGRTSSEAAFGRSMSAAGYDVSPTNQQAITPAQATRTASIRASQIAARAAKRPGLHTNFSNDAIARQDARSSKARTEAISQGDILQSPQAALIAADQGIMPSEELKEQFPRVYREARIRAEFANEGIKHDEVAQFVIDTAVTAGVGTGAKLAAKGGAKIVEAAAEKIAAKGGNAEVLDQAGNIVARTTAKETKVAPKAARRIVKGKPREVEAPRPSVKSSRSGEVKVRRPAPKSSRSTPKTEAPRPARTEVPKTSRVRAKIKTAKSGASKAANTKVGKLARNHPVIATGTLGVATNNAGVDIPGLKQAGALVQGHAEAIADNPVKTLGTTARAVPGILTGIAAPVAAGVQSSSRASRTVLDAAGVPIIGKEYTPEEIVSPTVDTVTEQAKGMYEMSKPLLSGDPEKVKKSVEDDIGLTLLTPSLKGAKAVRESEVYKGIRDKARARKTASRDRKFTKEAQTKSPSERKPGKNYRVRDSVDGGEYRNRWVGNRIENRRVRINESRAVTRTKATADREGAIEAKPIVDPISHVQVPKGRKAADYRQSAADSIATVAAYGIPKNRAAAALYMEKIRQGLRHPDPELTPAGVVTDLDNIRFLKNNPEIFTDKSFWEAVEAYKGSADKIETSQRKKYLAVAGVHGIETPEARMVKGVKVDGETIKSKDLDPDTYDRIAAQVKKFRGEERHWRRLSQKEEPGTAEHYKAVVKETEAKAEADKRADILRTYHKAKKQATKDFVADTEGKIREHGTEVPAYVKSAEDRSTGLTSEPRFRQHPMSSKQHRDEDVVRQKGTADRSFKRLLNDSVLTPRTRRHLHRLTSEFVQRNAVPVATKKGLRRYLTSDEIRRAVARGELDPREYAVFHSQHFKRAVEDPHKKDVFGQLDRDKDASLLNDLANLEKEIGDRKLDKGHKYLVVRREAAREFAHQFEGERNALISGMSAATRNTSRVILGYNPSWAAAQVLAEGLPAQAAVGVNPVRIGKAIKSQHDLKKMSPEDQAAVEGLAGHSPGTLAFPKPGFDWRNNKEISEGIAFTNKNKTLNFLKSVGKGEALGKFDRWKGGNIRKYVLAAKVDRDVNGFLRGLGGALKLDEEIRANLKGKSLAEKQVYLAKHPLTAKQLEHYLDDVMGNWRAITRLEQGPASFVAFYPYVRYSLKTAFWGFPTQHPIKATILAFMAQQNAEQLEKLAPGKPPDWLDYAYPVTYADGKAQVLPAAARIAPALNVLLQAVGTKHIPRIISGLNPAISAAYQGVSGTDPFTGDQTIDTDSFSEDVLQRTLLGLSAAASMFAPARFLSDAKDQGLIPEQVPTIRDIKPRRTFDGSVIGGQSATSKQFDELDPNSLFRSIINVLAPQSGKDYKAQVELERALNSGDYGSLPGSSTEKKKKESLGSALFK